MTFLRLRFGHVLAMVAALALLLVMAMDWYTDKVGEQDRFFQHQIIPQVNNDTVPSESQKLADAAATHEKSAWQAPAAIAAAFVRARGRRGPRFTALATVVGLVASLLVAYRIMQPPGPNYAAVVKAGAPLGLVCVGLLTLGSRIATIQERGERGTAAPEGPPAPDPQPTPAAGTS